MWERELRKIKGLYDNRLRASQQQSSKMEQALTNQGRDPEVQRNRPRCLKDWTNRNPLLQCSKDWMVDRVPDLGLGQNQEAAEMGGKVFLVRDRVQDTDLEKEQRPKVDLDAREEDLQGTIEVPVLASMKRVVHYLTRGMKQKTMCFALNSF